MPPETSGMTRTRYPFPSGEAAITSPALSASGTAVRGKVLPSANPIVAPGPLRCVTTPIRQSL
jgi:hypothetical protein